MQKQGIYKKMKLLLTSALAFLIIIPTHIMPVNAQEAMNDEEEQIRNIVSGFIEQIETSMKENDVILKKKGEMSINNAGEYYSIALPEMLIIDSDRSMTKIVFNGLN